ncbi:MAG: enoyl-CoA hydratase-related protein [Dehalococcoidia bacterium]|nr:enoyl-CoA hydratase-related protein [Dehalococcoidia bacterium]
MKLWELPKPVIAQVHGWCVGGGTDLALCSDLIFMAEDATIGYPPSRIYGVPTTMMWVYRLGLEHAKQFLLSGDAIDAATAYRIGLVSKVFPSDRLAEETERYVARYKHIPGNQLALNKMLINQAFENMGLRTTQMFGTFFDGVTRHTEEAYRWRESFAEKGFRQTIADRDAPFKDYGERDRGRYAEARRAYPEPDMLVGIVRVARRPTNIPRRRVVPGSGRELAEEGVGAACGCAWEPSPSREKSNASCIGAK